MKGFKKLLLFLVLSMILMSCDRKPDLAYEDACVHPNALKEIKYYVKHNISDADGLLIAAKKNSNEKIVKELLKSKNIEESEKLEALWRAIDNKNIKVFDVLLKATKGENSFSNKNKETILMKACKEEKIDIVKRLIKAGANVNAQDENGITALMFACKNNNFDIAKILLGAKADVNIKDHDGYTAFAYAFFQEKRNNDILNTLIKAGADVNVQVNGRTPLMIGCSFNDIDMVKTLIAAGADVNSKAIDGATALEFACSFENLEIVNILIAAGADVNLQDELGSTALFSVNKNIDIVKTLLAAGANVNSKLNDDTTLLMYHCGIGYYPNLQLVKTLIDNGAEVNAQDENGRTALMIACENGYKDKVNVLLAAGADVNAKNKDGKTALMFACEKGNKDIVSTLLATGVDIKKKDNGGATALIYSLENVSLKNILLEAGADPKEIEDYFDFRMITIPGKKYEMLSTEVTQGLYKKIMGTNPSKFKGDNLPVERVNWYEAIKFCNALSKRIGLTPIYTINGNNVSQNTSANGFRLPAVEEWLYAAKGGENYSYAGSNKIDDVAWYDNNSGNKTHPVAQKKPNGYGLYDMSGNVREWCCDVYGSLCYFCGGSWYDDYSCVVDYCDLFRVDQGGSALGFRLVRTVK